MLHRNEAEMMRVAPVQIHIGCRAQADEVWQVLLDQWIWAEAEIWLNGRCLYRFSRTEEGPALELPATAKANTGVPTAA